MTQVRDVIAQSQSGTGKTAMLAIASLQLIDTTMREIQVTLLYCFSSVPLPDIACTKGSHHESDS